MRLGGPIHEQYGDPDSWVATVRKLGYTAAYCPVDHDCSDDLVRAYESAATKADIVIAEVGAWSNPLSPDAVQRQTALDKCMRALALADRIGARCCVNIAGSRGGVWDGHDERNLTDETFDMIVQCVRGIIDAVRPTRTCYALETMPWMYPDTADNYLRLIRAVDRRHFGAHLDPVNMISSPQLYYGNAALIRECFAKLGSHMRSCHAKDIVLEQKLTVHLNEVRPGLGRLDHRVLLAEASRLDVPVMLEHLPTPRDYHAAAEFLRTIGASKSSGRA